MLFTDLLVEDEVFMNGFCFECPEIILLSGTFENPAERTCPCDFEPRFGKCGRQFLLDEIDHAVERAMRL